MQMSTARVRRVRWKLAAPITIADYRAEWATRFAQERLRLGAALGDLVIAIEHVGSTAVPGLAAIPIVDILVSVRSLPLGASAIATLQALGYEDGGDGGLPGRHRFGKDGYAVAIVQRESSLCEEPLLVRDYLHAHPEAVRAYGGRKRTLAAAAGRYVEPYARGKGRCIARMLEQARTWRREHERR
jgi:GrpB-like predicted nucleotidyltransferase (UPF0157 family)